MDNAKQKTTGSGWKVFGLTVVTWLAFTVLARGYASAMTTRSDLQYLMVDGQSIIWQWASLVMGIIMTFRLGKKWLELLWGGISFGVCIFPMGFVVGIGYFARCYFELEKKKKFDKSSAQIQAARPDAVGSTKAASTEQVEIINLGTAPKSGGYRMTGDDRQRLNGGDQYRKSISTKVTKEDRQRLKGLLPGDQFHEVMPGGKVTHEDRQRLKGLVLRDEERVRQRELDEQQKGAPQEEAPSPPEEIPSEDTSITVDPLTVGTEESWTGSTEEELYAVAWQELKEQTFDKGLWAKLFAENNGDESKTEVSI